jgi:16S rRNA (guanine527-N7)-methyltransferase
VPDVPAAVRDQLARLAQAWNVSCDDGQAAALVAYGTLLLTWNQRINLTGAASLDELALEHLPDSFALASRFERDARARVVDVGSGGGLPALPLALLRPALALRLIEPIAKKTAFLRTAVRELGLGERVVVHAGRAEPSATGDFDAALSRATLAPEKWAPLGLGLVRPGGRVFVLASGTTAPAQAPAGATETHRRAYADEHRWLIELTRS